MGTKNEPEYMPVADVEELIRKKDVSERFRRKFAEPWKTLLAVLSVAFVLFSLYFPVFGKMQPMQLRGIHLGFILALTYLYYPAGKKSPDSRPSVLDVVLILLSLAIGVYVYFNTIPLALRAGVAQPRDYVIGAIAILLVLESCRRSLGWSLLIMVLVLLLYAYFGRQVPGILSHRGYSVNRIIYQMFLTTEGIFGLPLGISATYMVLFIVLAAILGQTGLGRMFNDVSIAATGKMPGGPAKVAVIASGLFGMINGSAATNVATTGTFTIPLMKKVGYKPYFAAAVEAAASTGGQIMPPVMGTVAFLMAEFIGVPYIKVAAAAAIPAMLYFGAIYFAVDFRARKFNLRGVSDADVPDWKGSLRKYAHMLLPMALLVVLLVQQFTPLFAAFVSLVCGYVLSFLRKDTWLSPKSLVTIALDSSRSTVGVAVSMANAGLMIGVLGMTGLGLIVTDSIMVISQGVVLISLVLVAIVVLILGLGLPTTASYVIGYTIAAPMLIKMGVPVFVAHFFILYYACLSTVTPPVALAAYVGAGMAGANPNKVGWTAFRLALPGLIIAFFFTQSPALLLIADSPLIIVKAVITGVLGIMLFASGTEGYFYGIGRLPMISRVSVILASVLLLDPRLITDLVAVGVLILGGGLPLLLFRVRQARGKSATSRT